MKKVAPNSDLVNYIWTYLHKGYSLTAIRDSLVQQKYSLTDINYAIDFVYANYYYGENQNNYKQANVPGTTIPEATTNPKLNSKSSGVHKTTILALIVMGILLIGFSFVFVLSLNADSDTSVSAPPEGHEIILEPDVIDPVPSTQVPVDIVDDEDKVIPVIVEKTPDKVVIPEREFIGDVKDPFKADVQYTNRQIEFKVDYFSSRNPKEATKFCDAYSRDIETYFCYRDVAVGSGNPAYCGQIPEEKYRDDCYLSSVLENVDTGGSCNQIVDSLKKENCIRIVDINEQAREIESYVAPESTGDSSDSAEEYYAVVANFY